MVRWLYGFSLLSLSLLSFWGAQGSLLLSASMFLSGGITAGPFNSRKTSGDPTPQDATVNTCPHTYTPKGISFYILNILTFWIKPDPQLFKYWQGTGLVSWSYANLNPLNASYFPNNCSELDKTDHVGIWFISVAQPKFQQKCLSQV